MKIIVMGEKHGRRSNNFMFGDRKTHICNMNNIIPGIFFSKGLTWFKKRLVKNQDLADDLPRNLGGPVLEQGQMKKMMNKQNIKTMTNSNYLVFILMITCMYV